MMFRAERLRCVMFPPFPCRWRVASSVSGAAIHHACSLVPSDAFSHTLARRAAPATIRRQDSASGSTSCGSLSMLRGRNKRSRASPPHHVIMEGDASNVAAQRTFLQTTAEDSGKRLDQFLQSCLPDFSRSRLQDWIKSGRVLVNGVAQKPSSVIRGGEQIEVEPANCQPLTAFAEDIPVDILYTDADVIAVNKPAGLVGPCRRRTAFRNAGECAAASFQSLSSVERR